MCKQNLIERCNQNIKKTEKQIQHCNKIIADGEKYSNPELVSRGRTLRAKAKKNLSIIKATKKELIFLDNGDFVEIDNSTDKVESPIAEASRILTENFEVSSSFGTVNSEAVANILDSSLSTAKIHKAVLDNFDGVRYRKQNGGYTYTLKRIE